MDTTKAQKASELLVKKKAIESEISDIEKGLIVEIKKLTWEFSTVSNVIIYPRHKYIPEAEEFIKATLSHLLLIYKAKLSEINIEIMSL